MKPPISLIIDNGEKDSPRPAQIALAAANNRAFKLDGFRELPVDVRFELPDMNPEEQLPMVAMNCELKEPSDFVNSVLSGHLGDQVKTMVSLGEPGMVIVLGGPDNVYLAASDYVYLACQREGEKIPHDEFEARVDRLIHILGSFEADAYGLGIPVFEWAPKWAYHRLLSHAKRMIEKPNLARWLPRYPVDPQGYACLCAITGIGDQAAKAVLRDYETLAALATDCKLDPTAIAGVQVNGKKLGKAKANLICRAFGCEGMA